MTVSRSPRPATPRERAQATASSAAARAPRERPATSRKAAGSAAPGRGPAEQSIGSRTRTAGTRRLPAALPARPRPTGAAAGATGLLSFTRKIVPRGRARLKQIASWQLALAGRNAGIHGRQPADLAASTPRIGAAQADIPGGPAGRGLCGNRDALHRSRETRMTANLTTTCRRGIAPDDSKDRHSGIRLC